MIDVDGKVIESEQTVTEDISTQGATLFTTLQIPQGRFVRLISEQYRHHGARGYSFAQHRRRRHPQNSCRVHR